jgi:hypothetical protein
MLQSLGDRFLGKKLFDLLNDSNTSLVQDAMNRVSTDGLFVTFFFQIGITPVEA